MCIYGINKKHKYCVLVSIDISHIDAMIELEKEADLVNRIIIPTLDGSTICSHFGRSPYFVVIDMDENGNINDISKLKNTSDHFGGVGKPKDLLLTLNPTVLIVHEIGPGALQAFEQAEIAVFRTNADSIEQAIEDYKNNKLERLSEGCSHSKHGEDHR